VADTRKAFAHGLRLAALLLAAAVALGPESAWPQSQAAGGAGWKQVLATLWGRLRAATPRASPVVAGTTVTAGLRGGEATESELKPYWKGVHDEEPAAVAERQALERAQGLADGGDFAGAAKAFDAVLAANPSGPLAPNARFGSGLAKAALGDTAGARAALQEFLAKTPEHPLAADARQALAALP